MSTLDSSCLWFPLKLVFTDLTPIEFADWPSIAKPRWPVVETSPPCIGHSRQLREGRE